jgi:cation diffusion facilitator family transporter
MPQHRHEHDDDRPHAHAPEHEHGHDHDHPHDHDHNHGQGPAWLQAILHVFKPHSHSHHATAADPALANERGIRALKWSLAVLMVTAVFQVIIVAMSSSVALLADTLHNFSDALTAIPLWLAFTLARWASTRRYTYGYGRAEDLAGALIVLMIFGSALVVFYESIQKLLNPQPLDNLGWVAAAAIIGFVGNELVAHIRTRVGREIGSAALVADGLHARADGFTSLGVLAGAIGVWLGFPWADPLVGVLIGVTILVIVAGAARDMWRRMMDAIEPEVLEQVEKTARAVPGVTEVHDVNVRWLGHRQRAELHITVYCKLLTVQSHAIAEAVRHDLFHALPALVEVTVHVDPCECDETVEYHPTAHHRADARGTPRGLPVASP